MHETSKTLPIKILIIGLGRHATANYLGFLTTHSDIEIVAVCELPDRHAAVKKLLPDVPVSSDLESLLSAGKINTALISTPHHIHFVQALICIEKGLDIFMDKPLALTSKDAERLIKLSREKGCILYTALPRMHSALFRVISDKIRSGVLGKIIDYEFAYHRPRYPDFRNSWRNSKECGGGFLLDAGYHLIYMLLALIDSPVHSVKCTMSHHDLDVEIFVKISAKFADNSIASVSLAGHDIPNVILEKIYICGTEGILVYNRDKIGMGNDSRELILLKNNKKQNLSIKDKDDLDILPLKHFIHLYKSNAVTDNLLDLDLSVIQFIEMAKTNANQNHE